MRGVRISTFIVLISLLNTSLGQNDDAIPSTMCPRYSVNEFYMSLFKPLLKNRIDFIENLLRIASDGIEDMLVKVDEKKGSDSGITKQAMNTVRILLADKDEYRGDHMFPLDNNCQISRNVFTLFLGEILK